MSFEISGLDELERRFEEMEKAAQELEETQFVPFSELFSSSFLKDHSSYTSFEELLASGNFEVNSQADFEAIPDELFDKHISQSTDFPDWKTMLDTASSEYLAKKLSF